MKSYNTQVIEPHHENLSKLLPLKAEFRREFLKAAHALGAQTLKHESEPKTVSGLINFIFYLCIDYLPQVSQNLDDQFVS